jgi:integrase
MPKRSVTKFRGVYQRTSEIRLHNNKPDICYDINYQIGNRLIWEKVGWASEGYTAHQASLVRADRMHALRHSAELPIKNKAPFFKDVAKEYVKWAKANKKSGIDDESRYKNHLSERFDHLRLNEISSFELERFKKNLLQKKLTPATVHQILALFRQIFNKAVLWGMHKGENPIKGIKLPRSNNQRDRFLSYEEANLLLSKLAEKSMQVHDMALLSLHCGLRAGEIFNLKGQDLDFDNGLINISDPKNQESRKAFMTNAVREMLNNRIPNKPNELIFKDHKKGGKMVSMSQTFWRVVDEMGLNDDIDDIRQRVVFHSLRHTFASWLALQGETLLTIKELLGHKTITMTERYAHLSADHKKQATLALERIFDDRKNALSLVNIQDKLS